MTTFIQNCILFVKLYLLIFLTFYVQNIDAGAHTPSYELIGSFSHHPELFTQGLLYSNGYLVESAGMYGESSLQIVHPDTGAIIKQVHLPKEYFAEGIVIVDGVIFMLTWRENKVLLFEESSLKHIGSMHIRTHTGEGWGLTSNAPLNTELIVSDGSDVISIYAMPTITKTTQDTSGTGAGARAEGATEFEYEVAEKALKKIRTMRIVHPTTRRPLSKINELEYVREGENGGVGVIYFNVWYEDTIVVARESDGEVLHIYDLAKLYPMPDRHAYITKARQEQLVSAIASGKRKPHSRPPSIDCFNGIAYNSTDGTFLLTGKWWPTYYRVRFSEHRKLQLTPPAAGKGTGVDIAAEPTEF